MTTRFIKKLLLLGVLFASATSCVQDLDQEPYYEETSASVYKDFDNYKRILAKLYGGLILTGQQGPAGRADIIASDEGMFSYVRLWWKHQEVPTDEAVLRWEDNGIIPLNTATWDPSNETIDAMYNRLYYQIAQANEFIRETTDEKLAERGITGDNLEEARRFRTEARFLRALSYWHALDLFGSVPFVTEESGIGSYFPEQIQRADLFTWLVEELEEIAPLLPAPMANEYGRADQAAAWTLLAKLYLNAEVYAGEAMYDKVITYTSQVIEAGYQLEPEYEDLFLADNHTAQGIIFALISDGVYSKSYGGTTFLVNASIGGDKMEENVRENFGVSGGWAGLRTTEQFVSLFPNQGAADTRAMFFTEDQSLEINDLLNFQDGYAITKFKNLTSDGAQGSDEEGTFVDTDFPMFRLADVYLMYAEAAIRGGGGNLATAVSYINQLRLRAYGDNSGDITSSELTEDFILAERGRELYWEAHRRTDLIRFGKFTSGDYLWAWKGGIQEGRALEPFRTLYPIPVNDIINNPNLDETPGYTY